MQLLQHLSILWLVIALSSLGQATWPVGYGPPASSALSPSDEAGRAYINGMQSVYLANTYKQLITAGSTTCTINNIRVRQCWDDMSQAARQEYIRAAKCLAQQPSQADLNVVPGARTRIDDYIWQHVEQSNYIHNSGLLLPWHRQFIWAWEEDLRRTCNYTGALPYWDWSRHAYEQKSSPVFGIDSFGGNGAYVPHNATDDVLAGLPQSFHIRHDAGTGGGCVQDGPFANNTGYSLDIGLVLPANNSITGSHNTVFPNNTFGQLYQPRCLKRDFLQSESSRWANYTNVGHLMRQKDIQSFHPVLETGGVHFVGHSFVGGDGADFYASPNEPTFFLHHAQVDRLWTIWQAQDFANRGQALDGTTTVANIPPSANATLDTIMEMGFIAGGKVPIRRAMSAMGNAMCYVNL